MAQDWVDVGSAEELAGEPLRQVMVGRTKVALVWRDGVFSAISGVCNHVGGPLGHGRLDGEYVVCPWHNWKFHCRTGEGEPGYEEDRVPSYEVRIEGGRVLVCAEAATGRSKKKHPPHPLTRITVRGEPGGIAIDAPLRVAGISTTNMDVANPRFSTSEALLEASLERARERSAETRLIRLAELSFRHCEGYYSKSAHACTWPCSITQMDPKDQMDRVYEAVVQWADVILVATPIRWGAPSSLYAKMVERMNCVQNQETIANRVLMRHKTAAFIVTGGQDNVQAVVGQMLTFFGELGCQFPPFPFIAHSRGWSAEDMERNVEVVRGSTQLREGARALMDRCLETSEVLIGRKIGGERPVRGGRKAHSERE
ncbi:MAG: NAD(P)H-dependent oxidoreductase [Phycisphaeraceae bacterium]|nr:NAD(P)H-dependent oxidoreductase [Phycisphaeraceae bacterium]